MAKQVGPLNWNVPIVDDSGRPTREFITKWNSQAQVNAEVPDAAGAAAMSVLLDQIGSTQGAILRRGSEQWQIVDTPGGTSQFLRADGTYAAPDVTVDEGDINLADVLTNNASTARHGFLPKLSSDDSQYLDGSGQWSTPAGGGGGGGWSLSDELEVESDMALGEWVYLDVTPNSQRIRLVVLRPSESSAWNAAFRFDEDDDDNYSRHTIGGDLAGDDDSRDFILAQFASADSEDEETHVLLEAEVAPVSNALYGTMLVSLNNGDSGLMSVTWRNPGTSSPEQAGFSSQFGTGLEEGTVLQVWVQ